MIRLTGRIIFLNVRILEESRVEESLSAQNENSFQARNQLNGECMHAWMLVIRMCVE